MTPTSVQPGTYQANAARPTRTIAVSQPQSRIATATTTSTRRGQDGRASSGSASSSMVPQCRLAHRRRICHARGVLVNLEMTFATRVWVDPVPVPPTPVGTGDLAQLVPSRRVVDLRDQLDQGVALVVYPDAAEPWVL